MSDQIQFQDGAAYEKMMGVWSRRVGEVFIEWVNPPAHALWVDVGCGNGAFTQLIVDRCAPTLVEGIDPSEAQLSFARQRSIERSARFRNGVAAELPFPDQQFDVAAMALVIFFVPEPAAGVAEMVRVVKPGGIVCTYAWDLVGGGFPYEPIQQEMRILSAPAMSPPHPDVAALDVLERLWRDAGLANVQTRSITVERAFDNFDDYWETAALTPGIGPILGQMGADDFGRVKSRVKQKLAATGDGRFVKTARAHAVKGTVPG